MNQFILQQTTSDTKTGLADNLRDYIISNISVPQTRNTKVTIVESSPFTEVRSDRDIISNPVESVNFSVGRPTRKQTQATRMNIFSNKRSTYDITLP